MNYYAETMAQLCGIPARVYTDGIQTAFFSLTRFPKDPAELIEKERKERKDSIGFIYDDNFFYYGYVNHQNQMLLLGPGRTVKPDQQLISELILSLDVAKDDIPEFTASVNALIPFPLESVMQALCSLNYACNHEKKHYNEILINKKQSFDLENRIQQQVTETKLSEPSIPNEHNTYDIETNLLRIVEHGEISTFDVWLKSAPAVRGGTLSDDALRQAKNTFIATATLTSRAAIRGGMDINEALSLSDLYIQKAELMSFYGDILTLQMNMIRDYTEKVSKIRGNSDTTPFLISINRYISNHISEAIKSEDICHALYISKSVLFDKMKKETGKTVSEYILNYKINESKELLRYSDRSISAISQYLGFSSQSHYNRTFREFTGTTPKKYREKHQH